MLLALGLTPPNERDLTKDSKHVLRSVFGAWLPVSRAMLGAVLHVVPDPRTAQARRVDTLWPQDPAHAQANACREAIAACDPAGPLVVFCSKVIAVPLGDLPDAARRAALADSGEHEAEAFVAIGRVFAGTARPGEAVYVFGAKQEAGPDFVASGFQPLLVMGSDLFPLDHVPAGNVLALAGLGSHILKTGTVSTSAACRTLAPMPTQSAAILRVSVEPVDPRDWDKLSRGLRLLNKADAVLEVRVQPSGEHVVCAIGDLHLERCLKDLRERFAKVEFRVSAPLASFRETLVRRGGPHQVRASVDSPLAGHVTFRAVGFTSTAELKDCSDGELQHQQQQVMTWLDLPASTAAAVLLAVQSNNVLVSLAPGLDAKLRENLVSAFHLAIRAGALCEEPLWGVCFILESLVLPEAAGEGAAGADVSEGQVVAQLADGMRRCFKGYADGDASAAWSARLVEALFKCSLHCLADGDQLGKLFSVVSRRRGRVVSEGMIDGTSLFQVDALIPVVEAFGIADELRKKTSGAASSPQLLFSHWEVLDVDPLHKASTEDELEESGETVDNDRVHNIAYKFMNQVRKRKGLPTGEKVVAVAEKQRTMSRKR
jgi:ribosome assembly protein 1